jgi:hypothetical protein
MKKTLPAIVEILSSAEFVDDEDFQWLMVDNRMTTDYVSVLLVCSLILIVVVLL